MFATVGLFQGREDALLFATVAPGRAARARGRSRPLLLRRGKPSRFVRVQQARPRCARRWSTSRRASGLPRPRLGAWAAFCSSRRGRSSGWPATAARGARARPPGRDGRRRRGAVRGQRDRRAAGHAVEHRRLPGRLRGRARRLRRGPDRRARLRDHPPGGGDRDRVRDGHARARARGHVLAGPAPARAARVAGRTCGPRSKRRPKRHQRQFPRSSALSFRDGADAPRQTGVAARARARMRVLGAARCRPRQAARPGRSTSRADEAGDDPITERSDQYTPKPPGTRRR